MATMSPSSLLVRALWLAITCFHINAYSQSTELSTSSAPQHAHSKKIGLGIAAAFSPHGELWLVGLNALGQLVAKTSPDLAKTWSEARVLDTGTDSITSSGEDPVKLAFSHSGHVVIAYNKPLNKPYTGEVRLLRSYDGGASFSKPITVHHDRQIITHRFESIAFDRQDRLHAVWIDKRDQVLAAANPTAAYPGAAVYRSISYDAGLTFSNEQKLIDNSCECCRIAMTPNTQGGVTVMWRQLFNNFEIRDHALAHLSNTDTELKPIRVTFDQWKLNACPHHGPSLITDFADGFFATWFTIKNNQPKTYVGHLSANGQFLTAPQALTDELASHANIARSNAQLAVVWKRFNGQQTQIKASVSTDQGKHFKTFVLDQTDADNDYPVLVRSNDSLWVVWRTSHAIKVIELGQDNATTITTLPSL